MREHPQSRETYRPVKKEKEREKEKEKGEGEGEGRRRRSRRRRRRERKPSIKVRIKSETEARKGKSNDEGDGRGEDLERHEECVMKRKLLEEVEIESCHLTKHEEEEDQHRDGEKEAHG